MEREHRLVTFTRSFILVSAGTGRHGPGGALKAISAYGSGLCAQSTLAEHSKLLALLPAAWLLGVCSYRD